MKKDDFVTKDIEDYIVSIGYDGALPIEVRPTAEFIESKFPNSVYMQEYHLWREDLYQKAILKYPDNGTGFSIAELNNFRGDDNYYERRNYVIQLAIDEILKKTPQINQNNLDIVNFEKVENLKNTKDVIDADLNALKIYLGLGYSIKDAKKAFYKVFGDKSYANKKRYEKIKKFIEDYYDKENKS